MARMLTIEYALPRARAQEVVEAFLDLQIAPRIVEGRHLEPDEQEWVHVDASYLAPSSDVEQQSSLRESTVAVMEALNVPYRHCSAGVGIGEFHPESRYVDIINRRTGEPVGLKITAHDVESAETGARNAAEHLGMSPDEVTARWEPRP